MFFPCYGIYSALFNNVFEALTACVDNSLQLSIFAEIIHTLHRQNTKILKQIFPEKEYRGLIPISTFMRAVSALYIPTIALPILLEEICRPILGLYKSLTDT
jgi:hypothetical protein